MRKIIVIVVGGVVQDVEACGRGEPIEVEVRDYDKADGADPFDDNPNLALDEDGERYWKQTYKV